MSTTPLKVRIEQAAAAMGADLVGIGNIERWEKCPPLMSPAGILPNARSVIVLALHHGDGNVEQGGEQHPQRIGPYASQYLMNDLLDGMSYNIGRLLEDAGFQAVPIVSSNIWRYRSYKDLDAVFAPDMSHIYAAVAAGLAELGYSGLALTPEFGARNRFVSIVTTAELPPTPLLPGNTLCDRCKLCVKHCPSRALDKEVDGEVALEIEGRRYPRANKNLWRCSWGEHFDLDLDLPIPDKVDERVLLETNIRHGMRGGEMGQCLKFCLPPAIRGWDRGQTRSPRRKRPLAVPGTPLPRQVLDGIAADGLTGGLSEVIAFTTQDPDERAALATLMPNATAGLLFVARSPETLSAAGGGSGLSWALSHVPMRSAFLAARRLEAAGYDACSFIGLGHAGSLRPFLDARLAPGAAYVAFTVTNAPLQADTRALETMSAPPADLDADLRDLARRTGADAVGVAPVSRLDALADQLESIYGGERLLSATNKGGRHAPPEPVVTEHAGAVLRPGDHLPGCRSVIVLAARVPEASTQRVGQPPAEAVGPYAFGLYESYRVLQLAALQVTRRLASLGYRSAVTPDLTGTASTIRNARGEQPDLFCNAFAALAAGLGTLGRGGFVLAPRHGGRLRFLAIVTDAPLRPDALADMTLRKRCDSGCNACIGRCSVAAHRPEARIELEGRSLTFHPVARARCDWAKRFALIAAEGPGLLGSTLTVTPPPGEATPADLEAAMRQLDPIIKDRLCAAEMCGVACPA